MRKVAVFLSFLLTVALPITRPALGQGDVERRAGYIELAALTPPYGDTPSLEVNIKGPLLKLVAEASREDDPDLADLLLEMEAIQVLGFPLTRTRFRAMERASEAVAERLEADGWEPVVNLREAEQYVDMYVRQNADRIEGMFLLVLDAEAGESVFINIVGDIDPREMGRIGSKFTTTPIEPLSH